MRLSKFFDTVATVLVIVVSSIAAYSWLADRSSGRISATKANSATQRETEADIKGRFLELDGLDRAYAGRTIVVSLSTHCPFCLASESFYARLTDIFSASGELSDKARLVFAGPQPLDEFRKAFPALNKLSVTYLQTIRGSPARTKATPTILVADAQEKVQEVFIGRLQPQREKALLMVLTGTSNERIIR